MALKDDPALLRRPLGFAGRVNAAEDADLDDLRERLPGLLKFARTFVAEILAQEFNTPLAGFPIPARARAAALGARLKRERASPEAQRLVMSIVDLCDLEIDRREMSGEDDEEDDDAYREHILDLLQRLLDRFAAWIDRTRLPRLAAEATRTCQQFAAASDRLRERSKER
ncbi:MAG: hypothetical protein MSC31_16915 [Solirubrobacteraceae bacterium MAG38_C4-C5]|nr:hypothetical protein [Candidatus Siliceabacter maunaloa]